MSGHVTIISPTMRRYMLIILMVSYAINIVDRQILAILIVPIKAELGLSDTSIGFLTGFAFAIFYATAGLPIALLADRYNRTKLIAVALTLWSGMTALSGFAQNFWHLALARIGVGVGEAGGSPPAHSIIADLYKPERRSTALAIYGLGIPIGTLIGLGLGGWISQQYGWRIAFFAAGAPGLILAGVIALTFREPPRPPVPSAGKASTAPGLAATIQHMANTPVIVHIAIGGSLITAFGAALVAWTPTYLARTHGMELGEIGLYLGLIAGLPGAAGMYLGGALADRLGAKRAGWYLWTVAAALIA
ncbi:MAG: MFS transporter, partial [Pseudomonadota bacterium]